MKKNIAIVAGGDSSEVVVSLKSAEGIYSFIDKEIFNLTRWADAVASGRPAFARWQEIQR